MRTLYTYRTPLSSLSIALLATAFFAIGCDEPDEEAGPDDAATNQEPDDGKDDENKPELEEPMEEPPSDLEERPDDSTVEKPIEEAECEEDATREGSTPCGWNDRGRLNQVCLDEQWEDSSECADPDICEDESQRTSDCADGLSESEDVCVDGGWQAGTCLLKQTIRVSLSSSGIAANAQSSSVKLSRDGTTVVFQSAASNLVGTELGGKANLFAHDLATRETSLVSLTAENKPGVASSESPSVSADGNLVLFYSSSNFVGSGELIGQSHLYLKNRSTNEVTLVTQNTAGTPADNGAADPELSADGRFAIFRSSSTNLVPDDDNAAADVYLRDLVNSTTTCVSRRTDGSISPYGASRPRISGDSSTLLFYSQGTSYVTGDSNNKADAFLTNLEGNNTRRISLTENGTQISGGSSSSALSSDARFVTFISREAGVVSTPTIPAGIDQLYLRDTMLGTTVLVSQSNSGEPSNTNTTIISEVSPDGRYVIFVNTGSNLVEGDTNGSQDLFLRDIQAGTTTRLSVAHDGGESNGHVWLSPGGVSWSTGRVVVMSSATNLIADDTEGEWDAFLLPIH